MAAEKKTKRSKATAGEAGKNALQLWNTPRNERRYEPQDSAIAWLSMGAMSLGALLLGAGVYGQWMRSEELGPHPWASWLVLAGALVLLLVAFAGPRPATPVRVGDAGVGRERDTNDIERIEWRDVNRVGQSGNSLTVESAGMSLTLSLKLHAQAVARIVAEARERIPTKVDAIDDKVLEPLDPDEGEVLPLEAPQVAGERCKATDKLIAFEQDARMCARCGELYYKDAVPAACLTCEAKLR